MKKYDKIILIVLLAVFGVGIFMTARSAFDQYVTFAYAQEVDRNVQVRGTAIDGTIQIIDEDNFSFEMVDLEGTVLRVKHSGMIPVNLMEAEYIVVKGKAAGDMFDARTILVKCPSKYEAEQSN
ncbi:MAG: cytochrome c maturation protein CcmE [Bacillota bacterium]|nr:cytochrome c maturation protein CcmE [Bacillota bacterium]MDW7685119.1 cytochrome c maturation protein CcmE [Bacillota bacterium]